jgi:hypothetical protein
MLPISRLGLGGPGSSVSVRARWRRWYTGTASKLAAVTTAVVYTNVDMAGSG